MNQESNKDKKIKKQTVDQSKRKFAKIGLFGSPVLMTLHSHPVLAQNCFSGMISGNMSASGSNAVCDTPGGYALGRSPGYWKKESDNGPHGQSHKSYIDRNAQSFGAELGTTRYGDLNFFELFLVSENLNKIQNGNCGTIQHLDNQNKYRSNFCDYVNITLNKLSGLSQNPDLNLARAAAACYLNAWASKKNVDPVHIEEGYLFEPEHVIDLYQAGEKGGGEITAGGRTVYFTTTEIIQMFEDSWN